MTPEQIQHLRELEAKVGPPGSYGRNLALDSYRAALQGAGPDLLNDWERMRRLVEEALPYLPAATATQEEFCATVGHPTDHSDGRGRCYCQHYKPTRTLDDGFGNTWAKCERPDCQLQIVRPGKVQCSGCEEEAANLDLPDQPVKDS